MNGAAIVVALLLVVGVYFTLRTYLGWQTGEAERDRAVELKVSGDALTGAKWTAVGTGVLGVGTAIGGIFGGSTRRVR